MKTILTIDIGNTAMKAALFRDGSLEQSVVCQGVSFEPVDTMLGFNTVDGVAICCVGDDTVGIAGKVREYGLPVLDLRPDTPLPFEIDYDRSTLGVDRVAAAAGVLDYGVPVMLVDAGTAMTTDLIAGGRFIGGNISPGLRLRFRSLHRFTSRLPLVSPTGELPQFGHDTQTAIRTGVVRGQCAEVAAEFQAAALIYDNLKLVLTGGDASLLEPILKTYGLAIDMDSEVVGRGLVRIFNYNYNL